MKRNHLYSIAVVLGMLLIMSSCFDDPGSEIVFNDGHFVEIEEATGTATTGTRVYTRNLNGAPVRDSLRVNLVGATKSTPVTVNFSVSAGDPAATSGVHYNMVSSQSITIPAGQHFGYIYFNVLDDNIAPAASAVFFTVTLTEADNNVNVNQRYSAFTRGIRTQ
jgi:hypothetical protein